MSGGAAGGCANLNLGCRPHDFQHLLQREFDDGATGIGGAVINEHRFVLFHDARRKDDIGHEALPFVIRFGHENLALRSTDSSWFLEIEQQNSAGIGADAGILFAPAIAMIDFAPPMLCLNGWRSSANAADVPCVAAFEEMPMTAPMQQVWRGGQPHLRPREWRGPVWAM